MKKLKYLLAWLLIPQTINAAQVAPYFYTWGEGNTSNYKVSSLMDAKSKAGVKAFTLAFQIGTGGSNCALEPSVTSMASDIKAFAAAGGFPIASVGGANGPYLEPSCSSSTALFNALDSLIQSTGIRGLDFDVEGGFLGDQTSNAKRIAALKLIRNKYPNFYISYTLPTNPDGLDYNGLPIIQQLGAAGIMPNIINIMTMDYGAGNMGGLSHGQCAVNAAEALHGQIASVWPSLSSAQIYSMIGICPMIGQNDDSTVFGPSDATMIANYAKSKGIGLLTYWAFQRDQAGKGDYGIYSNANTSDFQFYNIFASSGPVVTPPPVAPCKDIVCTSGVHVWCSGNAGYPPNTTVKDPSNWWCYSNGVNGNNYNKGEPINGNGWTVSSCPNPDDCTGNTPTPKPTNVPTPKPIPSPTPSGCPTCPVCPNPTPAPIGCPIWKEGNTYKVGQVVSYNGSPFTCIQPYTAIVGAGWNPSTSPALWKVGGSCTLGKPRHIHRKYFRHYSLHKK